MVAGRRITVPNGCTLIFWGNYFDEGTAILFATTLREAGICVKMVGLNGPYATGQNGITLQSDISVSDIAELADQIRCVILPCNQSAYRRISNDPRMATFFTEAAKMGTLFIVNTGRDSLLTLLPTLSCQDQVLIYPEKEDLLAFAGTVACKLSGRSPQTTASPSAPYQIASPTFV